MEKELFIEYPKMKTLFKLISSDEKGKKWDATSGEILPETAAIHFIPIEELVFTEKIDGTNMGIRIDEGKVIAILKRNMLCDRGTNDDKFYFELGDKYTETIQNKNLEALQNVILYGELCGVKIQKGGNYFPERRFIMFDIYNTCLDKFYTWNTVKYFANELGIETVPEIEYTKADLKVENIKEFILNQKSVYNPNFGAEGMVIRYGKDTDSHRRWMAKIRKKDFRL